MSISYTADQLQKKFQGAPGASGFARIAETLREEGRLEEAVALCQEGLRQKPQNLTGHLVLGKCLLDMDRLEEAREQLEGILRQDPRCLSAMHLLARIMAKLQWGEAAAAYYRSILELEPWDTETLARFRDVSPAGAAGFVPAPASPEPMPPLEAFTPATPGPGMEEFDLNKVADFSPAESTPGELAGALEEVSLEDALSAPVEEPRAFAPESGRQGRPAVDEPKPLDVLTETAPADSGADQPAPISGDDVGDRLDSLFGADDDKPLVASPAPSAGPVDVERGRLDADFADATLQLKAMRGQDAAHASDIGNATTISGPTADLGRHDADFREEPASPTDTDPRSADLSVFAEAELLSPEQRVSGEDVEARLDDLFSLHDTATQPVMKAIPDETDPLSADFPVFPPKEKAPEADYASPAPEAAATWSGATVPDEGMTAAEAPAADTSESPVFEADPRNADLPVSGDEDLILAADPTDMPGVPGGASGEVVTGQDVADKLEALFGEEPAAKGPAPRQAATPDLIASGSASWAAARPAEEEVEASANDTGELPVTPDATTFARAGDGAPAWNDNLEASQPPSSDLMSTESMLPRGPGLGQAPPITGEDIEDRLDALFDIADEASRSGAMPRVEADPRNADFPVEDALEFFPAPVGEGPVDAAPVEEIPAPAADLPATQEVTLEEPPIGTPATAFPSGDSDRTVLMPAMKESPSDWLARQGDEDPRGADSPGAPKDDAPAASRPAARLPGAGDTLFMRNEDVFAEEPSAIAAPGTGDTVGMEMVDGSDIADRLDQIFAPDDADPRSADLPAAAAKAAADAAIARGEASPDGIPELPELEATVPVEEDPRDADLPALQPTEPTGLETGEMPLDEVALFARDPAATLPIADDLLEAPTSETVVSGDDIKTRLSEIFEAPAPSEPAIRPMEDEEAETPIFLADSEIAPAAGAAAETDDDMLPPVPGAADGAIAARIPAADAGTRAPETGKAAAPSLAPLQDEDEGSPEEDENSPQSAAGANVATVTLAEIYFQQGLREQALQIYRQLLEREPGNESVRKRIQEIEASKPEAGTGPGSDPRRPRPGLKVPKRKK